MYNSIRDIQKGYAKARAQQEQEQQQDAEQKQQQDQQQGQEGTESFTDMSDEEKNTLITELTAAVLELTERLDELEGQDSDNDTDE
jgi:type II secretory pathway pseudopilin PulG